MAQEEPWSSDRLSSPILGPLRITAERYIKQQPRDIRLGNDVNFIVKLGWQGKLDAMEGERPGIPELEGLRYLYVTPANGIEPEAGRAWAEFNYTLEPLKKGQASIGALEIAYTILATGEKGRLETAPLKVTILAPAINWARLFIYAGVAIVVILIGGGAIWLFLNLRPGQLPEAE